MKRFLFPTELVQGPGSVEKIGDYVASGEVVALITDSFLSKSDLCQRVKTIVEAKGGKVVVYDEIPPNPRAHVVNKCLEFVKGNNCGKVVCLGGGSPMDVAKVVAMLATNEGSLEEYQWEGRQPVNPPLFYIAIPTTAGTGSEATRTAVIIDRNTKKGMGNDALFAKVAIIDPEMMATLPPHLTSTTGIDALTHAIEACIGRNNQPFTDALAFEAISVLAEYLPRAYGDGNDLEAREKVGVAAAMAGLAMDQSGLGMIHSMSGPLSSYYDVPHGLSNAVLLPYGLKYNAQFVPRKIARIGEAMGLEFGGKSLEEQVQITIDAIEAFLESLEIPKTLESYFEEEAHIRQFSEESCQMFLMKNNPEMPEVEHIEIIFREVLCPK